MEGCLNKYPSVKTSESMRLIKSVPLFNIQLPLFGDLIINGDFLSEFKN